MKKYLLLVYFYAGTNQEGAELLAFRRRKAGRKLDLPGFAGCSLGYSYFANYTWECVPYSKYVRLFAALERHRVNGKLPISERRRQSEVSFAFAHFRHLRPFTPSRPLNVKSSSLSLFFVRL